MMWGYSPSWGGMFLMMVSGKTLWIALLGVLVWAVIRWFVHRPSGSGSHEPGTGPSAMEILRQRYTRGEIDTATFEQMRERLDATRDREISADFDGGKRRVCGGDPETEGFAPRARTCRPRNRGLGAVLIEGRKTTAM